MAHQGTSIGAAGSIKHRIFVSDRPRFTSDISHHSSHHATVFPHRCEREPEASLSSGKSNLRNASDYYTTYYPYREKSESLCGFCVHALLIEGAHEVDIVLVVWHGSEETVTTPLATHNTLLVTSVGQ